MESCRTAPGRSSVTSPAPASAAEPGAAQVSRAELGDIQRHVSRRALGRRNARRDPIPAGRQPPPPGVGRQDVVPHLDHHVDRTGVPPPGQRGRQVDDPDPQPVHQLRPGPPRVGQLVEQRIIDRALAGTELAGQVPAEQVGPERGAGLGIGGHQLPHGNQVVGEEHVIRTAAASVERIAARPAGVLGEQAAQRTRPLPVIGRIVNHPLPPLLAAGEEPGAGRQYGVKDLGQLGQGGRRVGEPQ